LHWRVVSTARSVADVALEKAGADGWLSLGFPATAGKMVPSDAFVASGGDVRTFSLAGYSPGLITEYGDGLMPVKHANVSVSAEAGKLVLRINAIELANLQSADLLFAKRDSGAFPTKHASGNLNRGGISVNMLTGGVTEQAAGATQAQARTHGVLQLVAWTVLAPLAVAAKRLGARVPRVQEIKVAGRPLPFVAHAGMMGLAIALSCISTGLAWANFTRRALYGHGLLGAIVFACAILQPLPAFLCRPDAAREPTRRRQFNIVHRTGGILTLALAVACIFLGVANYQHYWDVGEGKWFLVAALIGLLGACVTVGGVEATTAYAAMRGKRGDNAASPGCTDVENPDEVGPKLTVLAADDELGAEVGQQSTASGDGRSISDGSSSPAPPQLPPAEASDAPRVASKAKMPSESSLPTPTLMVNAAGVASSKQELSPSPEVVADIVSTFMQRKSTQ
jgi:hypothetical protein